MAIKRTLQRLLTLACAVSPGLALGAEAYPVFTDPNSDGLGFGVTDAFVYGGYGIDVGGPFAVYNQNFSGPCCHGGGISVPVSNGENEINMSLDGPTNGDLNEDIPNTTPANSIFSTIGNPSGKLENGNVLRFSAWFKSDPLNPIVVDPQIQPVLKFEIWKEALSTNADTNGGQIQPTYGDKIFDQEQHGGALQIPVVDRAQWIDFNGDGQVIDGAAAGDGRVSQLSTEEWTLVETTYTINDFDWIGIGDDIYTVEDVEEVRAVMFLGDFAGNDLTGDGDGGNLLVDNLLVEVFRNAASVTANLNPVPDNETLVGDYNSDGFVNAADYTTWRDGDSPDSSQAGYDAWAANYGASAATSLAVPEPVAASMAALGLAVVAGRRRSNR
ncbi:hypothetical protein Pla108_19010 [Botrimarina colliarenosi]|uniref:PEP-CTERM protein-sorting domain-containing protein n=1 Tax=Botrimarina colliarenosi TaxID=2528001 RepID=A0A5C6ADP9_9BACT|nr:hypothetical protein [Botrimarina colliarenosi]TWT97749.1 hypothetical protein Pla108_19010 [Botrimarina colliarenosi]